MLCGSGSDPAGKLQKTMLHVLGGRGSPVLQMPVWHALGLNWFTTCRVHDYVDAKLLCIPQTLIACSAQLYK